MFSFAFQLSLRHFLFLKTQTPTQTEKYVLFGGSKLIPGKSATTFKYVLFSLKHLVFWQKSFSLQSNCVCCSENIFTDMPAFLFGANASNMYL
jgi:hypothetical protein